MSQKRIRLHDVTREGTEKLRGIDQGQVINAQKNMMAKSMMIPRADALYMKHISPTIALAQTWELTSSTQHNSGRNDSDAN